MALNPDIRLPLRPNMLETLTMLDNGSRSPGFKASRRKLNTSRMLVSIISLPHVPAPLAIPFKWPRCAFILSKNLFTFFRFAIVIGYVRTLALCSGSSESCNFCNPLRLMSVRPSETLRERRSFAVARTIPDTAPVIAKTLLAKGAAILIELVSVALKIIHR